MSLMGRLGWTGIPERRWRKAAGWEVQPSRTLWDGLQLLIVPLILIAAVAFWNGSQAARERHRADQQRQDTTVTAYFVAMSGLMLHEHLLHSKPDEPVRAVARTLTLATLHAVDADRKADVLRFLYEAGLLHGGPRPHAAPPPVQLSGANLQRAHLANANLGDADFTGAELPGAKLGGASLTRAKFGKANLAIADLGDADLGSADLEDADLSGAHLDRAVLAQADAERVTLADAHLNDAILNGTNLQNADLQRADLEGADLSRASLGGTDLKDAVLNSATLQGADLTGADLRRANMVGADLTGAVLRDADLRGAILLDAKLEGATNLDLYRYIAGLLPTGQKQFLEAQRDFLDSLSLDELANFQLTPEKLAELREHADAV